jgi:hypothetical protein
MDASKELWQFLQTPIVKDILKCSLAYLLGSMFTFLPPLAKFLGNQDGKHIVATITVYFHPARSAGSMEEAAILGFAAFLYGRFWGKSFFVFPRQCLNFLETFFIWQLLTPSFLKLRLLALQA